MQLPADGNLFTVKDGVVMCQAEDGTWVAPESINMEFTLPKTVVNGFIVAVNDALQFHATLHRYWKEKAERLQTELADYKSSNS